MAYCLLPPLQSFSSRKPDWILEHGNKSIKISVNHVPKALIYNFKETDNYKVDMGIFVSKNVQVKSFIPIEN